MPRKVSLILFISLVLSGCAHGPKVTVCTSDPSNGGFQTYDERTKKTGFLPYPQSAGLIAYSELDAQSLLNACAQKQAKPQVVRCISHPELNEFVCENSASVPYVQSADYIGMTATDEKTLFDYCRFK